ncbi:STAS domain-containing protein [Nocardia sp. MW-W600-9]
MSADTELRGHTTILAVRGTIDAHTLTRWRRLLESAISVTAIDGGKHLIVDLSGVEFPSLRAILAMAELTHFAHRRLVEISVVDARPYAVAGRVVAVTGLAEWLPVYADRGEALAATKTDPPCLPAISARPQRGPTEGRSRRRRPWFAPTPSIRS